MAGVVAERVGEVCYVVMLRRPPRYTPLDSAAASDVYKRQVEKKDIVRGGNRRPPCLNAFKS